LLVFDVILVHHHPGGPSQLTGRTTSLPATNACGTTRPPWGWRSSTGPPTNGPCRVGRPVSTMRTGFAGSVG